MPRKRSRKQAKPIELLFAFGLIAVVGSSVVVAILPEEVFIYGAASLICLVALGFIIFYYTIYLKEKARREALLRLSIDDIDAMSGIEFEHYIEALLQKRGYQTTRTAVTGDFGVDLIATKNKQKIAVQCKRYSKPIGVKAVQEAHAGMTHYRCTSALVITNSSFTKAAVQLAKTTHCILIGRGKLAELVASKTIR